MCRTWREGLCLVCEAFGPRGKRWRDDGQSKFPQGVVDAIYEAIMSGERAVEALFPRKSGFEPRTKLGTVGCCDLKALWADRTREWAHTAGAERLPIRRRAATRSE
jgi:hypothetical protein